MTRKEFRKQYPACYTLLRDEIIDKLIDQSPMQLEEDLCSAFEYVFEDWIEDGENFNISKARKLSSDDRAKDKFNSTNLN